MPLIRKKTRTVPQVNHSVMMEEAALPPKKDDPKVIDIPNEERILYWAGILGCSRTDLLYAVINVGHSYKSVEAFLSMNLRKKSGGQ